MFTFRWVIRVSQYNQAVVSLKSFAKQFLVTRGEMAALGFGGAHFLRMDATLVASSIAINLLALALPLAILQVYDRIIPQKSTETLVALVGCLCVCVICEAILRSSRGYLTAWAAARFSATAIPNAFDRTITATAESFRSESAAFHQHRLQSVQRVCDFFGGRSRLLLLDLPFVALYASIMALIGGPIVLVLLVIMTAFAILTASMGRKLKDLLEARDQQDNKIHDFIAECLSGITTVKSMSMEPQMLRRFERLEGGTATTDFQTIRQTLGSQANVMALGNVTMASMVTFGALMTIYGGLSLGILSTCTLLSGRIIQPILSAVTLWRDVQRIRLGLKHVQHLHAPAVSTHDFSGTHAGPAAITYSAASCGPGTGGRLNALDLQISAGEFVAISGDDASGKLAILELACDERKLLSGAIQIEGMSVANFRRQRTGAIVLVDRHPAFFQGSILDNLTVFGRGATVELACGAAKLIGVDTEINRLLLGYDTKLGEGIGEKLPSGFLKRLSIARAIAMRPSLLLLDEPQAFLDNSSDKRLIAGLEKLRGRTTILMATSRPSYLSCADRIIYCSDGHLVAGAGQLGQPASNASAVRECVA